MVNCGLSGLQDAESSYQLQVTVLSSLANFSQTTHAGLLLPEEFLPVYLAVVWLVVLGETHWLHCTTIDGLIQVTKRIGFKDKKGVGRAGPGRELLGT